MDKDTGLAICGTVVLAAAAYGVFKFFAGPSKAEIDKANAKEFEKVFNTIDANLAKIFKDIGAEMKEVPFGKQ